MNHTADQRSSASSPDLMSGTDESLWNLKYGQFEMVGLNVEKAATGLPGDQIESETNPGKLLSLFREDSHLKKPVTIQAGYGRIWDDQSTLQKIIADHQEPSCAYVSANFSF